eukprot:820477-Amorphochlora_amoeboformis.AAC.1
MKPKSQKYAANRFKEARIERDTLRGAERVQVEAREENAMDKRSVTDSKVDEWCGEERSAFGSGQLTDGIRASRPCGID